jgi:hypothetical protein
MTQPLNTNNLAGEQDELRSKRSRKGRLLSTTFKAPALKKKKVTKNK